MTHEIVNPDELGRPRGWSNGMLAPEGARILFVAGQAAPDADPSPGTGDVVTGIDRFVAQFGAALDRVLAVVEEAGGMPTDVGRLTIYVTDLDAYRTSLERLGRAYRERMGKHFPAMALVEVSRLVDPRAVVEIEATAAIPVRERS